MSELIQPVAAWCATILEGIGVGVITLFALYALIEAVIRLRKKEKKDVLYFNLRQTLGRGILLGLEFLIAADIIYTVAIELSFQSISVLGLVVLIRTFLSVTLEMEINGRWPWQREQEPVFTQEDRAP